MYNKEEVRSLLPDSSKPLFDDIVLSRVLGANEHIRLIGEILKEMASHGIESKKLLVDIKVVATFFKQTRGQNSRAIYHAIMMYMCNIDDSLYKMPINEIRIKINENVQGYADKAKEALERLVSFGVHLCETMTSIMIFDYSSTVDAFVQALPAEITIYIPESRALDGGRPFVKHAVSSGHHVHFIPDTAMLSALLECDAAFMGAESFYPDGRVFNTIGSDMLSVLCQYSKKPLYVLTPMIKVDIRPVYGYVRLSPMPFDYQQRLAAHWDNSLSDKVDFHGFKLLEIKAEYISAFITELGVLPSGAIFHYAMEYAKTIEETDRKGI